MIRTIKMFLTELPEIIFPHPSINHYQANISKTEIDNIILLCALKSPKTFHCLHNEVNNYLAQKFLQFGFKYFFSRQNFNIHFFASYKGNWIIHTCSTCVYQVILKFLHLSHKLFSFLLLICFMILSCWKLRSFSRFIWLF